MRLGALILIVFCLLASCDKDKTEPSTLGKWKLKTIKILIDQKDFEITRVPQLSMTFSENEFTYGGANKGTWSFNADNTAINIQDTQLGDKSFKSVSLMDTEWTLEALAIDLTKTIFTIEEEEVITLARLRLLDLQKDPETEFANTKILKVYFIMTK
jgi:hypothetical protein